MTWYSTKGPTKVVDMDDSHLTNTIGYLERRAHQTRSNRIIESVITLSLIAENTIKDYIDADLLEFVPRVYHAMVEEARERGLWLSTGQPTPMPPYMILWETEEEE